MINIKDFPLCEKEVSLINDRFNTRGWVTLYEKGRVFSALITEDKTETAIANDAWDLCYWQTAPWINNPGGTNVYMRYYEDGVQPIVLIQEPKGVHIDEKVMLSEEFVMFLVLSVVRLLIDSLNEGKILKRIDETKAEVSDFLKDKEVEELKKCNIKGGISKFEASLISEGIKAPDLIKLMRNLQELRSTTAAHRKSRNSDKKVVALFSNFGLDKMSEQECFDTILINAKGYLLKLLDVFI